MPASGLFWTLPIPPAAITYDPVGATASFVLKDFAVPDFIGEGSGQPDVSLPATISMTMTWTGKAVDVTIRDQANQLSGSYSECQASIEWSAAETGFRYASNAAASTVTRFAQMGYERTGVFAGRV